MSDNIVIRSLREQDLPEVDRILRLAFGTFLELPDPMSFGGDSDLFRPRWRADPEGALAAFSGDELVGASFVANWGSFAVFGPLTVRPDRWDQGIGRRLLGATEGILERWGTRLAALFTFSHSMKHVALYQKHGFWPQHLTIIMGRTVTNSPAPGEWSALSQVAAQDRDAYVGHCRAITESLYPGLDLRQEIRAVIDQRLGDVVLLHEGTALVGFAVCHVGAGSEAGSGAAFVKFGAVLPGARAPEHFDRLLSACDAFAAARAVNQLVAGVNTARHDAYQIMLQRGFRAVFQGVAMQRPNDPGYNRPGCYVLDDWR